MSAPALSWREACTQEDCAAIRAMVTGSGVFSPEEIDVAVELAEDNRAFGAGSDYQFLLADADGKLAGYSCYGRIPFTAERYDLYWIVVDASLQQRGIATALMQKTESAVAARGGKIIYAETSSRAVYSPAHAFYLSHAFAELARLPGFYSDSDDKIIFGKRL